MDTQRRLNAKITLENHFSEIQQLALSDFFAADERRFENFSMRAGALFLDYSKNHVNAETIKLLTEFSEACGLNLAIQNLITGNLWNFTENTPVLHTVLRKAAFERLDHECDGEVSRRFRKNFQRMAQFTAQVRDGSWRGFTGKRIKHIIHIGVGGSVLGPECVLHALSPYQDQNLSVNFLSDVSVLSQEALLKEIDLEASLFIVVSKTFTTVETCKIAEALKTRFANFEQTKRHWVAVTAFPDRAEDFGIDRENIFELDPGLNGRYSLWSSVGLSVAIAIGWDNFHALLQGACEMDSHFASAPFEKNMPVLLALLNFWYVKFFHTQTQAIIPYEYGLKLLPNFLQQLHMESNGKRCSQEGKKVFGNTTPIIWGALGGQGQHAFHQLLHQGTHLAPVDFIVALKDHDDQVSESRALLFASCVGQAQALLRGVSLDEIERNLREKGYGDDAIQLQAPHREVPGNRPSSMLLLSRLTPENLGALIALYEHKVFVQSILWNINAFDQWGVELGKELTKNLMHQVERGAVFSKNADASTLGLMEKFFEFRKEPRETEET